MKTSLTKTGLNQSGFTQFALWFVLVITLVFAGCKSPVERDAASISRLEEELTEQAARPDKDKLTELLNSYLTYADQYPDDSLAPVYMYRAINLCMGMGNGQKAMEVINASINKYPNGPRLAETIFLKAYVHENFLGELGKASEIYRDFVHRFPDHELADDARVAIVNMGKTPEELVREFEAKSKQEQAEMKVAAEPQQKQAE